MRLGLLVMGVTVVGCGSVGDQPADGAPDGMAVPDARSADAAPPRCNPASAFATETALTKLNENGRSSEGARLTPDELTIYFSSSRDGGQGGYDVYYSTRASRDDAFVEVHPVPGVNSSAHSRYPSVSGDGLYLYAGNGAGNSE